VATVEYVTQGRVAIITINRPEARNAVNGAVASGLEAAVDQLEADESLWIGILTGVPPVFSAGADLKEVGAGRSSVLTTKRGGFAGFVARNRTKPIIAAVDGPALAGGTEIALACDLVVASTSATFGIPEVKRGLVAGGGGLFRLPRKVPFNLAMEMALTGDPIDAARAHQFGLVNRLCSPGTALATAQELAGRIEAAAPIAVRESRSVMLGAMTADEATGWRLSDQASGRVGASQDLKEGVSAFIEKRPPVWKAK
jgi:enoyl-CoA hydratase